MVKMREAADAAVRFLSGLYPDANDLRLEGIETNKLKKTWQVVVSMKLSSASDTLAAFRAATGHVDRIYKEVEVEKGSGEPTAFRVWKP